MRRSLAASNAAVKARLAQAVAVCRCGHGNAMHGVMGCEGVYTALDDAEPGPCRCKRFVARTAVTS